MRAFENTCHTCVSFCGGHCRRNPPVDGEWTDVDFGDWCDAHIPDEGMIERHQERKRKRAEVIEPNVRPLANAIKERRQYAVYYLRDGAVCSELIGEGWSPPETKPEATNDN